MPRYVVAATKAGINTANSPMWQLRAVGTHIRLVELALSVTTAPTTGPAWRLNRSTAIGTSSATVTPQTEDTDVSAAAARLDTTWSAAPTLASTDMRIYGTPNAIGSGIVWTWYDRPLRIPSSTGVVMVNLNAAGATLGLLAVYATFDE
jgi:hypothetical protein